MAQGDSLSPSLFILYAADLSDAFRDLEVSFLFYADDLVIFSNNKEDIQNSLDILSEWCLRNHLELNVDKTKIIKFRKGGRISRSDKFFYNEIEIEIVPEYEYLGVLLQTRLTFTKHTCKKKRKALATIAGLKSLHEISLDVAVKIYHMKILPSVTYAFEVLSPLLTCKQLLELDKIKAAFLKKVLGLHRSASSSLVHEIAGTTFLCDDLRSLGFEIDNAVWDMYIADREERQLDLCFNEFHRGPCFNFDEWKRASFKNRSIYTRTTCHGFHHRLCYFNCCFHSDNDCVCVLCGEHCDKFHILDCTVSSQFDSFPDFVRFIDLLT